MGSNCIFCRIAAGEIPAKRVLQDEHAIVFDDLHPVAPVHMLVIPREHIESQAHAMESHEALLGRLMLLAAKAAETRGLANGFRVVANTGHDGGQTVNHLHLHVLGGRAMAWPPG